MNSKSLLASIISIGTISAMAPNITKNINHLNQNQVKSTKDTIAEIAKKYESDNIDVSTITLDNFWDDISNSSIKKSIENEINITFDISRTNASDSNFIWYDNYRGINAAPVYAQKIKNQAIKLLECLPVLTLISDVAHFYGDNTTMNKTIREAAVTKDITLITSFLNWTKADGTNISLNNGILSDVPNWSKNYYQIIDNVLAKKYNQDSLLYQFNDINYDGLSTYNGNLHAADDAMFASTQTGENDVEDWFRLGNSSDPQKIKIHFNNHFNHFISWIGIGFAEEFSFIDPSGFYVTMH